MAKVKITIKDGDDDDIIVKMIADPPYPKKVSEFTPAQVVSAYTMEFLEKLKDKGGAIGDKD